uniref:Uncharacterized protein n=1 Tax=Anguilla anguilla TaxID=7936 RepID=A0A0E9VT24_ANGAN
MVWHTAGESQGAAGVRKAKVWPWQPLPKERLSGAQRDQVQDPRCHLH